MDWLLAGELGDDFTRLSKGPGSQAASENHLEGAGPGGTRWAGRRPRSATPAGAVLEAGGVDEGRLRIRAGSRNIPRQSAARRSQEAGGGNCSSRRVQVRG